ncbi:ZIP family metal transporter [Microbacterium terricola]|uniref:Divalent heavy-metal cations transporter n=1 Tax=Microbacterium terricola TaxID=344163 RepID=A0ABM8E091_9MICO|nr:ZIP family zinc transporter [Microbacterium terricola]UYK41037.1 ZIP family zinc transporter [Microbacterium terricola]BDV31206.1 divalent heavy-metal cations transporter [Microbacterium terricola]
MGVWLAALSGIIGGGMLLVGAAIAWFVDIPQRVVAAIMALGAGVLISTLAYELVEEAAADGGLVPTVIGFLAGALIYTAADWLVSRPAKPHSDGVPANAVRRRSAAKLGGGSGIAIALGALIDGIPESIVMGLSVIGGGLSIPIVAAVAISNVPEGLGSTAELKRSGASARRVFALWGSIAAITVVAAVVGYTAFQSASPELTALVTTIAAGGLLAMICSTMIPEAFEEQHLLTGLWATAGFLGAFVLHEVS